MNKPQLSAFAKSMMRSYNGSRGGTHRPTATQCLDGATSLCLFFHLLQQRQGAHGCEPEVQGKRVIASARKARALLATAQLARRKAAGDFRWVFWHNALTHFLRFLEGAAPTALISGFFLPAGKVPGRRHRRVMRDLPCRRRRRGPDWGHDQIHAASIPS